MSEWVMPMNIKPGELYRYEIKDEIKIARVLKNTKSWDGPYKGGRETEFTILFDNNDEKVIERNEKMLKIEEIKKQ